MTEFESGTPERYAVSKAEVYDVSKPPHELSDAELEGLKCVAGVAGDATPPMVQSLIISLDKARKDKPIEPKILSREGVNKFCEKLKTEVDAIRPSLGELGEAQATIIVNVKRGYLPEDILEQKRLPQQVFRLAEHYAQAMKALPHIQPGQEAWEILRLDEWSVADSCFIVDRIVINERGVNFLSEYEDIDDQRPADVCFDSRAKAQEECNRRNRKEGNPAAGQAGKDADGGIPE